MPPPVFTISTARQKFFSLFETVAGRRGRKIVIRSRGNENHAVLVDEAYLIELEAAARRLQELASNQTEPAASFRLMGSGCIAAGFDDPLADLRGQADALAEKKLDSFGK